MNVKPKLKITWLVLVLGLLSCLGFISISINSVIQFLSTVVSPILGHGLSPVFIIAIFSIISALISIVTGIYTYRKGERSWVLWLGFIPAILTCAFWIFLIVGELILSH